MKVCPFCGERLYEYSHTSYYDPPEWGENCDNAKCGKYAVHYFHYDGFSYTLGKWSGTNEREFKLRMKYHKRHGFR